MKLNHPPTDKEREIIRKAMQAKGFKTVELARLAGYPPSAVSAILGGYSGSKPAFEAVCKVLELEAGE